MPNFNKENVIVNLIPNSKAFIDHPQTFSHCEQLYLELLENKSKIKQNLINKDYIPKEPSSKVSETPAATASILSSPSPVTSVKSTKSDGSPLLKYDSDEANEADHEKIDSDDEYGKYTKPEETNRNYDPSNEREERDEVESSESPVKEVHEKTPNSTPANRSPPVTDDLSNKLQNLLSSSKYTNKYSREKDDGRFEDYKRSRVKASLPTLSQLEQQGLAKIKKEMPDIARMNNEDEDLKREMLFKFDLLKKSYKDQQIPQYTIHSDYNLMKKSYDDTVRRLSLDNSVENYKKYMIGAFMVIEYALGKWLHFDMQGYTQQQIISMSSYEKLLVEIGEKSYVPSGKKWPVEVRLIFLVIINTAFFIVGKMIMKNTGSNILNAINNMNKATNPTGGEAQQPKKKMKGPEINLDDLPDVNDLGKN